MKLINLNNRVWLVTEKKLSSKTFPVFISKDLVVFHLNHSPKAEAEYKGNYLYTVLACADELIQDLDVIDISILDITPPLETLKEDLREAFDIGFISGGTDEGFEKVLQNIRYGEIY